MCSRFSELDQLATQANEGDEMAWLELYGTLWPLTVSFVRRKVSLPHDLAQDLAQDIFLLVLNKLDSWDSDRGRFVSWFFTVADHHCIDYWRREHPGREVYLEDEDLDPPALDSEAPYETIENRLLLAGPLQRLKPEQRDLLFLKAVCGLKSHEIAEMKACTPDAIRQRLTSIRRILKKEIDRRR